MRIALVAVRSDPFKFTKRIGLSGRLYGYARKWVKGIFALASGKNILHHLMWLVALNILLKLYRYAMKWF